MGSGASRGGAGHDMASLNAYMMAAVGEEEEEATLRQGQDSAVETCFHSRNLYSDRLNVEPTTTWYGIGKWPLDIAKFLNPSKSDNIEHKCISGIKSCRTDIARTPKLIHYSHYEREVSGERP